LQVAALALPSVAFTPANVLYGAVSAVWGASPFDAFVCKDGFTTSFNMEIEPFDLDSDGTIDFWLKKLDVTTRAQPVTNVTVPPQPSPSRPPRRSHGCRWPAPPAVCAAACSPMPATW